MSLTLEMNAPSRLNPVTALWFPVSAPCQTGRCGYSGNALRGYTLRNPTVKAVRRILRKARPMATHLVSFRINHDSGHSDRWASTVSAIRSEAEGGTSWDETTSLVVLKSNKTADSLAASVYLGSSFSPTKDTLLVVNASNGTYATRGKIDYPATLASLFNTNSLASILAG